VIELALARHADRPILPVLLKQIELPSVIEALVGQVQYIDLTDEIQGLDTLSHALSNHFGSP